MDRVKRYHRFIRVIRPVARLAMRVACGFTSEPIPVLPEPFVLLVNHTSNLDPVCVGGHIRQNMIFVAGAQIFRSRLGKAFFEKLLLSIKREKGGVDAGSLRAIVRTARSGNSLCIFPEGTLSFTGRTRALHPTTAGLLKLTRAHVVTYRISGGYLQFPRWGRRRYGKMTGRVINVYSPEEIAAMGEEEVLAAVSRDLYEDAANEKGKYPLRGAKGHLAEGLETVLFLCPRCGGKQSLHTAGNRLWCDCGLSLTYTARGVFAEADAPFPSEIEWDAWQQTELPKLAAQEGVIFSDEDQEFWQRDEEAVLIGRGILSMTAETLSIAGKTFSIPELRMEVIGRETLVFSHEGVHYEVRSPHRRSAYQYLSLFQYLNLNQKG